MKIFLKNYFHTNKKFEIFINMCNCLILLKTRSDEKKNPEGVIIVNS